jgi:NIPSNAP
LRPDHPAIHDREVNNAVWLAGATAGALLLMATFSMHPTEPRPLPIIELRQYTMHPGKRDALIELFEREFIESQEALGMSIVGTFRDLDDPDRFVWIRGFSDMNERARALHAFYSGPIWQAHRSAANATMIDSDNVFLLRVVHAGAGFSMGARTRPPQGASDIPHHLVVANIYHFESEVTSDFIAYFERIVSPILMRSGISVRASYITETTPNNFPRLPVREREPAFVWFSTHADSRDYEERLASLAQSAAWTSIREDLRRKLKGDPEVHRLEPTARSALRE